jgi:hypothetical protein
MFDPFIEEEIIVDEVLVEESVYGGARRHRGRSGFQPGLGYGGGLGIDITDGDIVENFGDGLGVDLDTGQLEFDDGGFDTPVWQR